MTRTLADGPSRLSDAQHPHDSGHGAFIVDGRGIVLGLDARTEALTGWSASDVVGKHKDLGGQPASGAKSLGSPPPSSFYEGSIPVPFDSDSFGLRLFRRDGRVLDVEALATRLAGAGERVGVNIVRIVSVSQRSGEPAVTETQDALTGLLNQPTFLERLGAVLDRSAAGGSPLALILADVDHMRRVNDQAGRKSGDEALCNLASMLRAETNKEDLLARLGDDDFAIALRDAGSREARETAGRLRATAGRFPFFGSRFGKDPIRLTLSFGAAAYPADAENATDLLDRAREALRQARAHGRDRVWCYARRPRTMLRAPVYLDGSEPLLVGIAKDLSPSGIFVQTPAPLRAGMRCALSFPLPGWEGNVHVIGRVVRAVPPRPIESAAGGPLSGMAIEFERFSPGDQVAVENFLHANETSGA